MERQRGLQREDVREKDEAQERGDGRMRALLTIAVKIKISSSFVLSPCMYVCNSTQHNRSDETVWMQIVVTDSKIRSFSLVID